MKSGTSLYLDLVRFSAAMMVFFEHLREHTRISFSPFWRAHPFLYSHLLPYSQTAVIVFFVLSGYVIAHVLETREKTLIEYSASRFARLYSVVVPALILTAATNGLEAMRYPDAFKSYAGVAPLFRYLGTALFVSDFWLWPSLDPPNTPFWSLSFEGSYYFGIALFVFARGYIRFLSLVVLILATGPTIVLLAPTWLLGYGAYHLLRRWQPRPDLAIVLWLASIVLLSLCALIELRIRKPILPFSRLPDQTLGELLACYAAAICFAMNIVTFSAFSGKVEPFFLPFSRLIRWLGSITFALYLFHQPLLSFFTVYGVREQSAAAQLILLVGGTLLIVSTLGRLCEQSKEAYRRFFLSIWRRAAGRGLHPVAQPR
jgi:peptidoglycan/LPS O-acetylase OafA/YrhL